MSNELSVEDESTTRKGVVSGHVICIRHIYKLIK